MDIYIRHAGVKISTVDHQEVYLQNTNLIFQTFTTFDVDMTTYEKIAKEFSNQFASEYVNYNEFTRLKEHERVRVVVRFLEENR